jgi:hypothetical protein
MGRGAPEVTSSLDCATPLLTNGPLTCFVYLFSFKSYSTFLFQLETVMGAEIIIGDTKPRYACEHQ